MMKKLTYLVARVAFLSIVLGTPAWGIAAELPASANRLQAVDVTALPGGRLNVQLQLSQPLTTAPISFT